MVEAGRSPNIEILTLAEVEALSGKPGHFKARVRVRPRYIDPDRCTACGQCMQYCPREAVDEYNERLDFTRAARIDFPQAVPTAYYIDEERCLRLNHETCQICTNVCGPKAIDFDQRPEVRELEVGAVVLCPGFGEVPEEALTKYGYGKYPDVMTSLEVERLMCVSGPTEGEILRPSDLSHPRKIAFLQCVGSRDVSCGRPFCSSVCCMYAMKEASMLKEHAPEAEITLFFMDVRTQGKGFDAAFERAVEKYGLRTVYARVPKVESVDGRLGITYVTEDGEVHRELFDMVVLSVGLSAPPGAEELARKFGIELNPFGFARTSVADPLTVKPGIYVAGAFQGPKDIPESVMQASGAAARVSELLSEVRGRDAVEKSFPPEDEELLSMPVRIGVFVCHCGVNIAGVVDVEAVKEYAAKLPGVVYADTTVYSCAQDSLERLKEIIREHKLNRLVIAACSPRTHEPLFQETLREAGLNLALVEMANIRDQCSWVHADDPEAATAKAKDQVRMAVAKARRLKPLELQKVKVTPSALVIGGGAAGMTAALSIAEQGFEVYLVEKEAELGGNLRRVRFLAEGEDPRKILKDLIKKVERHPRIRVFTRATVENISGYVGNFTSTIRAEEGSEVVNHGVVVVATGAREHRPSGYLYGESSKVLTQLEFEEKLARGKRSLGKVKRVVMIQCAGSRGEELSHCSKICCQQAVKNALRLKELQPEAEVFILYRDMRTYGFYEELYREARNRGVIFLRYSPDRRPEVVKKGRGVVVRAYDRLLGEEVEIPADLVVLSVGIEAEKDNPVAQILKTPLNPEGFILEAHVKLKPVEVAVDGVYVCGLAHGPKPLSETLAQARAAAAKAAVPLAKGFVEVPPIVSRVEEKKCIGCGICASLCPYSAIEMVKVEKRRKARVIAAACKGCGICGSHCPVFAITLGGFTDEAILEQIRAFGQEEAEEKSAAEAEKEAA
ncbi:FAD-dependent oxidoreductase [Thermosulfurimonas sp. F29]|nr:FAD-dependent oxidoreductase [Thermosulfurimonas sp. F29]MBX6423181.1 FAD-dependent oxidoreductase [Thermosulfurimonas sp. F29]